MDDYSSSPESGVYESSDWIEEESGSQSTTCTDDEEFRQALYEEVVRLAGLIEGGEGNFRKLTDMIIQLRHQADSLKERNHRLQHQVAEVDSDREQLRDFLIKEKQKSEELGGELQRLIEEDVRREQETDQGVLQLQDEIKIMKIKYRDLLDHKTQLEEENRKLSVRCDHLTKLRVGLVSSNPEKKPFKPLKTVATTSTETQTDPLHKTIKSKECQAEASLIAVSREDKETQCFYSEFEEVTKRVDKLSIDDDSDCQSKDKTWQWFRRVLLFILGIAATSNVIEESLSNNPYVSWEELLGIEVTKTFSPV